MLSPIIKALEITETNDVSAASATFAYLTLEKLEDLDDTLTNGIKVHARNGLVAAEMNGREIVFCHDDGRYAEINGTKIEDEDGIEERLYIEIIRAA